MLAGHSVYVIAPTDNFCSNFSTSARRNYVDFAKLLIDAQNSQPYDAGLKITSRPVCLHRNNDACEYYTLSLQMNLYTLIIRIPSSIYSHPLFPSFFLSFFFFTNVY